MINRLLDLNELNKDYTVNFRSRNNLLKTVENNILEVEIFLDKSNFLSLELSALKKILVSDLVTIFKKSHDFALKSVSFSYADNIFEYEQYLIGYNINHIYSLWLGCPLSFSSERK